MPLSQKLSLYAYESVIISLPNRHTKWQGVLSVCKILQKIESSKIGIIRGKSQNKRGKCWFLIVRRKTVNSLLYIIIYLHVATFWRYLMTSLWIYLFHIYFLATNKYLDSYMKEYKKRPNAKRGVVKLCKCIPCLNRHRDIWNNVYAFSKIYIN